MPANPATPPALGIIAIDPSTSTPKSPTGLIGVHFNARGLPVHVFASMEFFAPAECSKGFDSLTATRNRILWTAEDIEVYLNDAGLSTDLVEWDMLAIEDGFHRGGKNTKVLDWARGVYACIPSFSCHPVMLVNQGSAKDLVGANFQASESAKSAVQVWARQALRGLLEPAQVTQSIADAYAIARAAWGIMQERQRAAETTARIARKVHMAKRNALRKTTTSKGVK